MQERSGALWTDCLEAEAGRPRHWLWEALGGRFRVDFIRDQYPLAVGRQASDLDRPAPSMSRGISAAHHRRWAAYAIGLGFRVWGLGLRVWGLGFGV